MPAIVSDVVNGYKDDLAQIKEFIQDIVSNPR